jgi:hypothetical protein
MARRAAVEEAERPGALRGGSLERLERDTAGVDVLVGPAAARASRDTIDDSALLEIWSRGRLGHCEGFPRPPQLARAAAADSRTERGICFNARANFVRPAGAALDATAAAAAPASAAATTTTPDAEAGSAFLLAAGLRHCAAAFAQAGLGGYGALLQLRQLPSDQLTVLLLVKLRLAHHDAKNFTAALHAAAAPAGGHVGEKARGYGYRVAGAGGTSSTNSSARTQQGVPTQWLPTRLQREQPSVSGLGTRL